MGLYSSTRLGFLVGRVVPINTFEVMPPSEMEILRQRFDGLEASRENKKFISQEINLHFTHRSGAKLNGPD